MPANRVRQRASWALAALGGLCLTVPVSAQVFPRSPVPAKASSVNLEPSTGQCLLERMLVELAWMADPQLFPFDLRTRVHNGVIEIQGQVPSQAVREQALKVAQQQASLPVVDRLQINPSLVKPFSSHAPETVQKTAGNLLTQSFGEGAGTIKLAADPQGVIILTGTIGSYEDKVVASRNLRRIPGCSCVVNQLVVATENREGRPFARISRDSQHTVIDERPSGIPQAPWLAGSRPSVEQVSLVQSPATPVAPVPATPPADASQGVSAIVTEEVGNPNSSRESPRVDPIPIKTVTGTMVPYAQRQPHSSAPSTPAPVTSSGFRLRDWLFGGVARPSPETRKAPIPNAPGETSARTRTGLEVPAVNRTARAPESSGSNVARSPIVLEIKDPTARLTAPSTSPLRYETRSGIVPVKKEVVGQTSELAVVPPSLPPPVAKPVERPMEMPPLAPTPLPPETAPVISPRLSPIPVTFSSEPAPLPTPAAKPLPAPLPLPITPAAPLPVPETTTPDNQAPNYWSWNNGAPPVSTTLPVLKPVPIRDQNARVSFPLTNRPVPAPAIKPLPPLAATPLPTLTATPLPLPKREKPVAAEPGNKTETAVEAYMTTGVVNYLSEEPLPEKTAPPAPKKVPPPPRPEASSTTWIQRKIEMVCGPTASYVEVTSQGPKVLQVRLSVRTEDEAKRLSRKILDMPELVPYEVDLNVDIK